MKNIENKLHAVVTKQEAWKVSDPLRKNIAHYVAAACLSVTIQAYHNDRTTSLIMQKIRNMNLDLPPTFDQDAAAQSTLKKSIEEALTQCCATMKKIRYAYKAHHDSNGQDYWGRVDAMLQEIRAAGSNDKRGIARYVKAILSKDRSNYGVEDSYKMPEHTLPSALQVNMDQQIDAADGLDGAGDDDDDDKHGKRNRKQGIVKITRRMTTIWRRAATMAATNELFSYI
ncbi:hypothetical protein AAF712_013057 [Marasmius tenuissimus]|uniref:Uncharacterized protein n=1 Tax=Marasmius tenuissimus TaxID=585030 RepID=A0ABR2ZFU7_9AGAR